MNECGPACLNGRVVEEAGELGLPEDVFAFPLSPAQEQMWRADRQLPGNPIYNASFRWNLEGALDRLALERSFDEIIRRHEILRATFRELNGTPVQIIAPAARLHIPVIDLGLLGTERRESEVERLCAAEARQSFDLATGPLIRVRLLRLGEAHHILTLTLHHIVADGWSIGLIMEELQQIYPALAAGAPSPLSELAIQYADYVIWQREAISGEVMASQLEFWHRKLTGYCRLDVPGDLPRLSAPTTSSAIDSAMLPHTLSDALKTISTEQGGTLFVTALAACLLLLYRLTGRHDLAVGSPVAGRGRTDVENLIGLFVNRVVFRVAITEGMTFRALEARVRETVWEALANQEVPFEQVLQTLESSGPVPAPFYTVNFISQREYARANQFVFEFAGIRLSTMPSKSQGALYDLNFFMVEREAGWRLSLEYNTDLYSEAAAQRMRTDLEEIMRGIVADPDRKLEQFVISGAPGAPQLAYRLPVSVTQRRFWLLAKASPRGSAFNMPACVRLSGGLAVAALEQAFRLVIERHETLRTTFEMRDGELSQIVAETTDFVLPISDLGTLPEARREAQLIESIAEEVQLPFDLAHGPLLRAHLFRLGESDHVLTITLHHILADGWSQGILQRELWASYAAIAAKRNPDLAPLPIQYGDFSIWQQEWLASSEAQEHFDFWTKQLAAPLPVLDFPTDRAPELHSTQHGALIKRRLSEVRIRELKAVAQSEGATIFMLMLAGFAALLYRYTKQTDILIGSPVANRRSETESLIGPFANPFALRLDLSGEPTLGELVRRVRETSLDALAHTDLPFELLLDRLKVRSVRGRNPLFQFYFLYQTAFLQPTQLPDLTVTPLPTTSVGTPFELQLAIIERRDGVLAQLEYSPELFDPGSIERILDDYETLLTALTETLSHRIIDVGLPERVGRPTASPPPPEAPRERVPPRNFEEIRLAKIWSRILEQAEIGVEDSFFDLGGQSLLAAALVAEIEKEFGVTIDLSTLVMAPTIEKLETILSAKGRSQHRYLVPFRTTGAKPPLYCVHHGGGHLLGYRDMVDLMKEDRPVYGLRPPELDKDGRLPSVEELGALYAAEIREFQKTGPYLVCGMSFGGLVAYEIAWRLANDGHEVALLALFDTSNPAYFRNLSFSKWLRFRTVYFTDRFAKYGRRLVAREFRDFAADLRRFVRGRYRSLAWHIGQWFGRRNGASKPHTARYDPVMFDAVGKAYTPKPYPGRIELFRAAERTPEYGDDLTLGWRGMGRNGVNVYIVPGGHVTMMQKPDVIHLVKLLDECIARSTDGHVSPDAAFDDPSKLVLSFP